MILHKNFDLTAFYFLIYVFIREALFQTFQLKFQQEFAAEAHSTTLIEW